MNLKNLLILLCVLGLGVLFSGCVNSEEENAMPWAQPASWQNSSMPGVGGSMPNYGDRNY